MRYDLYRFLDVRGQLLYVGMTSDINRRMSEHKNSTPWIDEVHLVHVTHGFESLERLAFAEAVAIRHEKPLYNLSFPHPSRCWGAKRRGRPRQTEAGFDKTAYQRDFMRKKRAAQKAAKE